MKILLKINITTGDFETVHYHIITTSPDKIEQTVKDYLIKYYINGGEYDPDDDSYEFFDGEIAIKDGGWWAIDEKEEKFLNKIGIL